MRTLTLTACLALALVAAACSDDEEEGGCSAATFDIPARDIAEGLCDTGADCTICVQARDDAGLPATYLVYEGDCPCPHGE